MSPFVRRRLPDARIIPNGTFFALMAAVVAILVLEGCGIVPTSTESTASSPSQSLVLPRVPATQPPSASPVAISVSRSTGINLVGWAPDGRHLLLDSGALEVIDAQGRTVATPGGTVATWIDTTRFATWTPGNAGAVAGTVMVVGLDGSTIPVPGTYVGGGLIGDGVGDLTLMPLGSGSSIVADHFVIWSNGRLGDPMPGWPLGWSRDGSTLIIATSSPLGGTAGSTSSVSVALMTRPFLVQARPIANVHVDPNYVPAFDLAGSHVAFPCAAIGTLGACHQLVDDLSTATIHDIAVQAPGLPVTWTSDGALLLAADPASGSGVLREWNGSAVVASSLPKASWALASPSGYVALVTEATDSTHTTRIINSIGVSVAELAGMALSWSQDGSAVAIKVDSGLQLTLFRIP